ncbi:hypothetical protein AVEN_51590-1, partial [Araneus ventricosus]
MSISKSKPVLDSIKSIPAVIQNSSKWRVNNGTEPLVAKWMQLNDVEVLQSLNKDEKMILVDKNMRQKYII